MIRVMDPSTGGGSAPERVRRRDAFPLVAGVVEVTLAILGIAASMLLKAVVDARGPLWLDEAWTAAIARAQPFGAFVHQAWLDPNPPLYFLLMHAWVQVAGLSAAALRAPSLAFALATPLVVALVRTPGLSGPERLTWAAVLALWGQAILYAQEARAYSLLILVATLQVIAFVRLLRAPTRGRAFAWAACACLAILTHYHALILTAAQGVLLLLALRRQAVRLWPALLAFLPALAWIGVHAPRVLVFARPEVAWYPPMDPWLLEQALDVAADGWPVLAAVVVAVVGGIVVERELGRAPTRFSPGEGALWLAAAASMAGAVAVVLLGFMRPSFTPRYLVAFGPGVLLGLVIACRNLSADGAKLGRIGVLLIVSGSAAHLAWTQKPAERRAYQFQTASDWLMAHGVRRLAVVWDNPTDRALAPEESRALFSVFFDRARRPVVVSDLGFDPDAAPDARLLAATPAAGDGLMWLYDVRVPNTAARRFAPILPAADAADPGLACRRFAGGALGVWACARTAASSSATAAPR
ncbi:MAG: hypothetical protein INR64_11255 [Caulobacteraceae bacterium]|nr:hypothetical protein [Caulobacter sp.]